MNETRAYDIPEPSVLDAGERRSFRHAPLSLQRIDRERHDNRPAFPGDPDMDWQSAPERPHDPKWGLPT